MNYALLGRLLAKIHSEGNSVEYDLVNQKVKIEEKADAGHEKTQDREGGLSK